MKAVFTTKSVSIYDDLPEERYHFPGTYLRQVEASLQDWIVYYEPRRDAISLSSRHGRQSYFATARVLRVERDPHRNDHFYAMMGDYLDFDYPVHFKDGSHYFENGLRKSDGSTNKGAFGRAVRTISPEEYDLIVKAGFSRTLGAIDEPGPVISPALLGFEEDQWPFERSIIECVVRRPFREAAFSASVKRAYCETCAVTGLRILNGGGRSEVQAAHIRPVSAGGSDSVRNGLALSGTIHWMFDSGLISIDENLSILIADDHLPAAAQRLIGHGKIAEPTRQDTFPHPANLRYHREHIFKG